MEIQYEGVWGTICDDGWDNRDAGVVCRQLGFATGVAHHRSSFGRGSGPVWLEDMYCEGGESQLNECRRHNGWEVKDSSCKSHGEDAGVTCYDESMLV